MSTQLSDKELSIIEEIYNNSTVNQRMIAKNIGISIGLTNLIIKRLIKTGYIKVKQLNKRKIKYILTPKGFAEKTKKTYNYILKTTNYFWEIYKKLQNLIIFSVKNGKTNFYILANDEIFNLLEIIFKTIKFKNIRYQRIFKLPKKLEENNTLYLVINSSLNSEIKNKNILNLLYYLS